MKLTTRKYANVLNIYLLTLSSVLKFDLMIMLFKNVFLFIKRKLL